MISHCDFATAVKRIAWAYIFLYLNINLGTINLLPEWVGYIYILSAIPLIEEQEESAKYLRTPLLILAGWAGISWLAANFGFSPDWKIIYIFPLALRLYMHFQLLTNIADITAYFGLNEAAAKIKKLRSLNVIFDTALQLMSTLLLENTYILLAVSLATLAVVVVIAFTLFSLVIQLKELDEKQLSVQGEN